MKSSAGGASLRILNCTMAVFLGLALSPATAGPIADQAAEAEKLLADGEAAKAFDALDAAINAFWDEAPLTLRRIAIVDENGIETDDIKPGASLRILVEPAGYGFHEEDGQFAVAFSTAIEIRQGNIVFAKSEDFGRMERKSAHRPLNFSGRIVLDLPELRPGAYELAFTLTDDISGKRATTTLPLSLAVR